eukprot:gene1107-2153_t
MSWTPVRFYLIIGIVTALRIRYCQFGIRSVNGITNMASFGLTETDLARDINSALEAHKSGNLDNAITLYEKVIPNTSGQMASTLNNNIGAIYMQRGDYDNAFASFSRAVEALPDNAQSYFNLAVILTTKLNKHARAIKHCGTALKLDPKMHKAYHLMGNILQTIGRPDEADKYFQYAEDLANESKISTSQPVSGDDNDATSKVETGWSGLPIATSRIGDVLSANIGGQRFNMTCVSERPRAFLVSGLLTSYECDEIRLKAEDKGRFEDSFIMGGGSGGSRGYQTNTSEAKEEGSDPYRLSSTTWLPLDPLLEQLQRRVAGLTNIPHPYVQQQSEDLQVVKYSSNGRFKVHQDSSAFHPRLLTALVYLTDAPMGGGGETWFPFSGRDRPCDLSVEEAIAIALQEDNELREAGGVDNAKGLRRGGLSVTPVKGDAVIFMNHLPDGTLDAAAVHAGLRLRPLSEGNGGQECTSEETQKWIANYWIGLNMDRLKEHMEI